MLSEINERWRQLCEQVAVERDPEKFAKLIAEISLHLEQREAELRREQGPKSEADSIAS